MTGITNYTGVSNSDTFAPPADITKVYEHFDPLIGQSVANAGALPPTGNWVGRMVTAVDTTFVYVWSGTAWKPLIQTISGSVKRSSVAATIGGGVWGILNGATWWTVDQPALGLTPFSTSWVAPIDGWYQVEFGAKFNLTANLILAVQKNTTVPGNGQVVTSGFIGQASLVSGAISKKIRLSAGDYLVPACFLSATAVWDTTVADASYFSIKWVEPLR